MYASENWILSKKNMIMLNVRERTISRSIYGSVRDNEG